MDGYNAWGDMAELIIFDTQLSDTDRGAVESYLQAKYVPEPSTIILSLMGLMGLLVMGRRRG